MTVRRRRFLFASLAAGLAAKWGRPSAAPLVSRDPETTALAAEELEVLGAYVATLLPADGQSPSAGDLAIHKRMARRAAANTRYRRLLQFGTRWLHHRARNRTGQGFAELDEAGRTRLVREAEESERGSLPELFFRLTRLDAFEQFYADPKVWRALGYPGAPQPVGFPDFAGPPQVQD